MNQVESLALILLLLVVFVIILKMLGVADWHSSWGSFQVSFGIRNIPNLSVSLGNELGLVVSQDGLMYKVHLRMVIVSDKSKVIDNFTMVMDKRTKFRIKQFYTEDHELQ